MKYFTAEARTPEECIEKAKKHYGDYDFMIEHCYEPHTTGSVKKYIIIFV